MASRSSVAIDDALRKRIKKLSALLDVSQGEIIEKAIAEFERLFFNKGRHANEMEPQKSMKAAGAIFDAATHDVWESDPAIKAIQQKLRETPGSIDDYIIDTWDSGLES
ncbi:MAG: hypothetical protein GYA24_06565 [Candidatus Lokiarchaeota archaeon]|nr:hypothetical protein [Candidatus Lokiarchaeota archaeon]